MRDGAPGAVFWGGAGGVCRFAVVLAPDRAISEPTLAALGLVALFDALAVLAPPQVPIVVAGRDLVVDGGRAGSVQVGMGPVGGGPAMDAGAVPEWAVLGFAVTVVAALDNPGEALGETSLMEEGFEGVGAAEVVGQACRYLLAWIDAWRDEGAAGLERALMERVEAMPVGVGA